MSNLTPHVYLQFICAKAKMGANISTAGMLHQETVQ
jgi:hypothetical protein